jgi:hypothetical protein
MRNIKIEKEGKTNEERWWWGGGSLKAVCSVCRTVKKMINSINVILKVIVKNILSLTISRVYGN